MKVAEGRVPRWTDVPAAPRWGDRDFWAAFVEDVRPRFLVVRLRVGALRLRWGVPLWAIEEPLRFVLLMLPWAAYLRTLLRSRARHEPERSGPVAAAEPSTRRRPPWHALVTLLDGGGESLLRMERGLPFVRVEAGGGRRSVHVEITQL